MRDSSFPATRRAACLLVVISFSVSVGSAVTSDPESEEQALASWAQRLATARQGVPPARTRSRTLEQSLPDPVSATRALLSKHVALEPAVIHISPTPLIQERGPEDVVCAISFTAPDGSRRQFASHLRPDDHRPLYHYAAGYAVIANPSFEQASTALIQQVLSGRTEGLRASGVNHLLDSRAPGLTDGQKSIALPWSRAWVFIIDDAPGTEWDHPCRYVFLAPDLSAFAVQYARRHFQARTAEGRFERLVCVVRHPAVDSPEAKAAASRGLGATTDPLPMSTGLLDYSGSAQNCYALLISGGVDPYNNFARYWRNLSAIYTTLVTKYNYPKDHITVLMSDGLDPAVDRNVGDEDDPEYENSDPDLDQDGIADVCGAATWQNVALALTNYQNTLTADDQLFIFVTDHGCHDSGQDVGINLWDHGELRDDELKALTDPIPAMVIMALGECYSGGFVDDFMTNCPPNRVIATACAWNETSTADSFMSYWCNRFTSSVRGFWPNDPNVWEDGLICDADSNDDGRVTMHEAVNKAAQNLPDDRHPVLFSNPLDLCDRVYLNHLHTELDDGALSSYFVPPHDFSWQINQGQWAIVGAQGMISPMGLTLSAYEDRLHTRQYAQRPLSPWGADFVVANGRTLGDTWHYARMDGLGAYYINAQSTSPSLGVDDAPLNRSMQENEVVNIAQVLLNSGDSYNINLAITGGNVDLGLFVFDPGYTNGTRADAVAGANEYGYGTNESVTICAHSTGYYGVAVLKCCDWEGAYALSVSHSPSLSAPSAVHASKGAYHDKVEITWEHVTGATHYRLFRSDASDPATAAPVSAWFPAATTAFLWDPVVPGQAYYYWMKAAAGPDGLRASALSPVDSGYATPPATALTSGAAATTAVTPSYYQFRDNFASWWVVGARPNSETESWGLYLYDSPECQNVLKTSVTKATVDFIVGDNHHLPFQDLGVGTFRVPATGGGTAAMEFEGDGGSLTVGTNAVAWPAGDVVRIWSVWLEPGTYRVSLDFTSGSADLDVALFGSQDGVFIKNRQECLGGSAKGGPGQGESFFCTIHKVDYYGLCVSANDANAAAFRVVIEPLHPGVWQGGVSADWHYRGNWENNQVPTAADDVTIPTDSQFIPVISAADASCKSLTLQPGTLLMVVNRQLMVISDATIYGSLTLKDSAAAQMYVGGSVLWENGSLASVSPGAAMRVSGNWVFDSGANVQLTGGIVYFSGTGPSVIRANEPACRFYDVISEKAGASLGLSARCAAPVRMHGLLQSSGSLFLGASPQPLVLEESFANLGGHFQFTAGEVVYEGSPAYALTPNSGDFLHDLTMRGSGALRIAADYANRLRINGNLRIEKGQVQTEGVDLDLYGDWSNAAGSTGFAPSTNSVRFCGGGQDIRGSTTFYDLVDARTGGGDLTVWDAVLVNHDYVAARKNVVEDRLSIKGTLSLNDTNSAFFVETNATVDAASLNLGGLLVGDGGVLTVGDLVDNGLYGNITLNSGRFDLAQGSGRGDRFDLYGHLTVAGGRLNLIGGGSTCSWPPTNSNCSFTMTGGILDFARSGWQVNPGFTGWINNGLIRCANSVLLNVPDGFNPAGGTLELYGPDSATLSQGTDRNSFHDLVVNKTGGGARLTSPTTLTGGLSIQSGVLNPQDNTITVYGDWNNAAGPAGFICGLGTVVFAGAARSDILTDQTFYKLQLDKKTRYSDAMQLAAGRALTVLNDLVLTDGTLRLNAAGKLIVGRDLILAAGAGLMAFDPRVQIHIGRNWSNGNTDFDRSRGFNPGYDSTVVFDGGNGWLATGASVETFNSLTVDRPGAILTVQESILTRGDLTVNTGSWASTDGPHTNTIGGNFTVMPGAAWQDHVSALLFAGTGLQYFDDRGGGFEKDVIVAKATGEAVLPLMLATNMMLLNGGSLTVREGYMDLNGHFVRCTGSVRVGNGGNLRIGGGAWLEVGNASILEVQAGGRLSVLGTPANPAKVTRHSGNYAFAVRAGGMIRAQDAIFEYMDANGVSVEDTAVVEEPYTFNGCTFQNGAAGGALLALENSQTLTVGNAVFPINSGGGGSNARKLSDQGAVCFVHATGAFAGPAFENDPHNRVNWSNGNLASVAIDGPLTATLGGAYDFVAAPGGDTPLTPISYYWTATDQTPVLHRNSTAKDTLPACCWSTAGGKVVSVVASNDLGVVHGSVTVNVESLALEGPGRRLSAGTNVIDLFLNGTSDRSHYMIEYSFTLGAGSNKWITAAPGGISIPGANHQTPWTDVGGPGRDLNQATNLFYRARLLSP